MTVYLYAILSDIHANYEALKAVAEDANRMAHNEGVDKLYFISLGDVVDYGPQPNECMAWVKKNVIINIQGNHDRNVSNPDNSPPDINEAYWPITLWTRRVLKMAHKQSLKDWPPELNGNNGKIELPKFEQFVLFHSNLKGEKDGHIKDAGDAKPTLYEMEHRWQQYRTPYGLFGHTHHQGYFVLTSNQIKIHLTCEENESLQTKNTLHSCSTNAEWRDMPPAYQPTIMNPGSVGQPRRHKFLRSHNQKSEQSYPRASYMLLKMNGRGRPQFQFRRVPYNVEKTVNRLSAIRWEPVQTQNSKEHSIYKDEKSVPSQIIWDPRLERTLKDIQHTLPELIKNILIPKLTGEHN